MKFTHLFIGLSLVLSLLGCPYAKASYFPSQANKITMLVPATALGTTGSPSDIATITVPSRIGRYAIIGVWVYSATAAGTLAGATLDIRTATAGGGASLLAAPVLLTGLTAVNLAQALTVVGLGTTYAGGGSIVVRQTTDSLSAGTITVAIEILVLS